MRKTKEQAQQTKESILMAALDCFSSKGFFNTSLDDIAKTAEVTRGAVYWHFKNKAEIFDALHEELHEPFVQMILKDLETEHAHPVAQLKQLCIKLLHELEQNPNKTRTMKLFFQCDYSGDLTQFKQPHQDKKLKSLKLFAQYFERAKDKSLLTQTADPNIMTLTLHCFLKGILYEYLNQSDLIDLKKQANELIEQLFKGLQNCQSVESI
jgi:AcrR family transcriptional regulator